ncbi:hypothetical protein COCON_G00194340 [Conger conger]|uniref:Uncharacterized protein n=1 Tax=Conger conger TaxID=82655 RepID=A0A9Q1D0X2_CONCO|nr:hypothetical protein COCON_G00194340 [Conger conger]
MRVLVFFTGAVSALSPSGSPRRPKAWERAVLQQDVVGTRVPAIAYQQLPPPRRLLQGDKATGQAAFVFVPQKTDHARPPSEEGTPHAPILPASVPAQPWPATTTVPAATIRTTV